MQIKHLYGKKLMVDANAFVYYLTNQCNNLTVEILEAGVLGKVQLITTVRIVDELLFKMLMIKAVEVYGWKSKILEKLTREPEKIKTLSYVCRDVLEFLQILNLEVIEIKKNVIFEIPKIMSQYGLIGNDAITLKIMQQRNLKYILTADEDFKKIKEIVVLDPLK